MDFELNATLRDDLGRGASRRLRRQGLVPAIIYGGDAAPQPITVEQREITRQLDNEGFYSHIITLHLPSGDQKVILRDLQRHLFKPLIEHADFQRVDAEHEVHVHIPLHFLNENTSPGVKQEGGLVSHTMIEVEVICLPQNLPEFIEVDLGTLHAGQAIHMSELPVPEGVRLVELMHGNDAVVASIQGRGGVGSNAEDGDEDGA